ncbi:peptidylprolyl isomerase [Methylomagnum sp.]
MKKYPLIAAVTGALLAAGCDKAPDNKSSASASNAAAPATSPAPVSTEDAAAIVNGKPISKASVEILKGEISQRRGGNAVPDDKIIEELIKRELLRQEAEAEGLLKDPKFAARVENATRMVLSQAAAERFINSAQVTDEELKKEYDQRIGPMTSSEFKAKHILVETEQAAKDVIAKLQKGEKFDALAKKLSKDPGSKDKGGDLGWFNPQQMVPPFSQAVMSLKNGETTKAPVQSQFGWHVIAREDSRDQPPPPFDTVKDQLKSLMQTQKLQQHMTELQAKAKIENRMPPPKAAEPPAADAPKDSNADTSLEAGKPTAPTPAAPAQPAPAQPAEKPQPAPAAK